MHHGRHRQMCSLPLFCPSVRRYVFFYCRRSHLHLSSPVFVLVKFHVQNADADRPFCLTLIAVRLQQLACFQITAVVFISTTISHPNSLFCAVKRALETCSELCTALQSLGPYHLKKVFYKSTGCIQGKTTLRQVFVAKRPASFLLRA